jgi:hypothetical protein
MIKAITANLDTYNALRVGDTVEVSFGSRGTQKALVEKITPQGNVYVCKYRERSGSWTKPVRLYPTELRKLYL